LTIYINNLSSSPQTIGLFKQFFDGIDNTCQSLFEQITVDGNSCIAFIYGKNENSYLNYNCPSNASLFINNCNYSSPVSGAS
jgi:hypothetical protein